MGRPTFKTDLDLYKPPRHSRGGDVHDFFAKPPAETGRLLFGPATLTLAAAGLAQLEDGRPFGGLGAEYQAALILAMASLNRGGVEMTSVATTEHPDVSKTLTSVRAMDPMNPSKTLATFRVMDLYKHTEQITAFLGTAESALYPDEGGARDAAASRANSPPAAARRRRPPPPRDAGSLPSPPPPPDAGSLPAPPTGPPTWDAGSLPPPPTGPPTWDAGSLPPPAGRRPRDAGFLPPPPDADSLPPPPTGPPPPPTGPPPPPTGPPPPPTGPPAFSSEWPLPPAPHTERGPLGVTASSPLGGGVPLKGWQETVRARAPWDTASLVPRTAPLLLPENAARGSKVLEAAGLVDKGVPVRPMSVREICALPLPAAEQPRAGAQWVVGADGLRDWPRAVGDGGVVTVASQLNWLESMSPQYTGLEEYHRDYTQGPQTSLGYFEALVRRDASFKGAETADLQPLFGGRSELVGGYLELSRARPAALESILADVTADAGSLRVCVQEAATTSLPGAQKTATMVMMGAPSFQDASAPPSAGSPADLISAALLEAQYDAAARVAVYKRQLTGGACAELHLTLVGGGAFQNRPETVERAVIKAVALATSRGVKAYVYAFRGSEVDRYPNLKAMLPPAGQAAPGSVA